jgi:hypothetical protein
LTQSVREYLTFYTLNLQRLNIIKTLSRTSWGAHYSVLIKAHKALILSKLDYGSSLFSSANQSYLKKLNTPYNTGMRLSIGAFRSSPQLHPQHMQYSRNTPFINKMGRTKSPAGCQNLQNTLRNLYRSKRHVPKGTRHIRP